MHAATALRRQRRFARGAVLVEALIVIVALILCLLGFLYLHAAFSRQLQVQKASRAAAFAFAMNGCEGGVPSGLAPDDLKLINAPDTRAGSSQGVGSTPAGKIGEPAAANAFTNAASKNTGFGMPAAVAISARGEASATDGHDTLSSTLHSRTTLLCNETPRERKLESTIEVIADFLKF